MRYLRFISLVGVVLCVSACGGGGGSDSTPPSTLYVRASAGKDTNSGTDPDNALSSIAKAALAARGNAVIIVGPGTYDGSIKTGTQQAGLQFIADPTGKRTNDPAGDVIVDGQDSVPGFNISNDPNGVIDGFTVVNASPGIAVKSGSHGFTVRNCVVHEGTGDGIIVLDSRNVLVFNNLVFFNAGIGLTLSGKDVGSPNASVINNTLYGNAQRGLLFGNSAKESPYGLVLNNIIVNNGPVRSAQIKAITDPAPRSDVGLDVDHNWIDPLKYDPSSIGGANDESGDPLFVDADNRDYHLQQASPAIGIAFPLDTLVDPRGVLTNGQQLRDALRSRVVIDGQCDGAGLDLGFHYRIDRCP